MRKWIKWFGAIALSSLVSLALAAGETAASGAKVNTPQEDFEIADKADKDDDMIKANTHYRKAADAGHPEAQARLGHILYRAGANFLAYHYFKKSAEQGNTEGMYGMAYMTQGGEGDAKQDITEARKWYAAAADKGHHKSINALADGCIGPTKNQILKSGSQANAEKLLSDAGTICGPDPIPVLKRAADINYVPAIVTLAEFYRVGKLHKYEVPVNDALADEYEKKLYAILGGDPKKQKKKRRDVR
ncbi:MAG: hypothetical protein OEV35_02095 [Gallionellaceae bacterium]|nr:hypothetical protein [Gallionellaceae bacterium]